MKISDLFSIKSNVTEATDPALIIDPDKEMDRKEIYAMVNQSKKELGPRVAEMMDMWIDGHTLRSISDHFNLSSTRVSELIKGAILTIRDKMNLKTKTDVGYLYGYKKKQDIASRHRAYTTYPTQLAKDIKDDPSLKMVRVGGNGFMAVDRSDPRPEVEYTPDYADKVRRMKEDLIFTKKAIERLIRSVRFNNERRLALEKDPSFKKVLAKIPELEKKIEIVKAHGTWQDKELNEEEVWDKPNPKKKHSKLSPEKKAAAKARAKRAGRPYPNLIDNMWASKK